LPHERAQESPDVRPRESILTRIDFGDAGKVSASPTLAWRPVTHLILQRQRSDCWITGSVIVTLRYLGIQHTKRDGKREGSDDDYAFSHHGSPLDSGSPSMRSSYSTAVCDGHHRFGEIALRGERARQPPRTALFPPPALGEGGHRCLARLSIAVCWRAIFMVPE